MKKIAGWLFVSVFMVGCSFDAEDVAEQTGDGSLGAAEDALCEINAIDPNAIDPNAIDPNAIDPNALDPTALSTASLSPSSMSALQDPGEAGALSRMLMKYLVSCAFDSTQSFSFSWTQENVVHDETYWGSVALAPDWSTRGLTLIEQRWVSACIAARTNYYQVTVIISMRGTNPGLAVVGGERATYSTQEGAFWGNLFSDPPHIESCYNPTNVDESREVQRDCATGHWDGSITTDCANIDSIGPCTELCDVRVDMPVDGFASCNGVDEVITTYLDTSDDG